MVSSPPSIRCYNCNNPFDPGLTKGGLCPSCLNKKYPPKPSPSDPLGIKDSVVVSYGNPRENIKDHQDDCKMTYEALPKSVRLTYYLLAKYEFNNIHSISQEIERAWKSENNK